MYVWVILSNLLQVVAGKSQNPHLTGVPGKLYLTGTSLLTIIHLGEINTLKCLPHKSK